MLSTTTERFSAMRLDCVYMSLFELTVQLPDFKKFDLLYSTLPNTGCKVCRRLSFVTDSLVVCDV